MTSQLDLVREGRGSENVKGGSDYSKKTESSSVSCVLSMLLAYFEITSNVTEE